MGSISGVYQMPLDMLIDYYDRACYGIDGPNVPVYRLLYIRLGYSDYGFSGHCLMEFDGRFLTIDEAEVRKGIAYNLREDDDLWKAFSDCVRLDIVGE